MTEDDKQQFDNDMREVIELGREMARFAIAVDANPAAISRWLRENVRNHPELFYLALMHVAFSDMASRGIS